MIGIIMDMPNGQSQHLELLSCIYVPFVQCQLNPPPSEALKRMHMLACDSGIIAIMNKVAIFKQHFCFSWVHSFILQFSCWPFQHRWRVGIMTEMAPIGYVGVSPKCILGFNKNMGEEISLRLRTDDLKGFRKYESIKRTLLHELAHMVHSEHDANFFALNKQLNDEAASLDWTKSKGHMLSGHKIFDSYEDEFVLEPDNNAVGHKLGGPSSLASARMLSGDAAYQRLLNASSADLDSSKNIVVSSAMETLVPGTKFEPDPDDVGQDFVQGNMKVEPDPDDDDMNMDVGTESSWFSVSRSFTAQNIIGHSAPDPDDVPCQGSAGCLESVPDDSSNVDILNQELRIDGNQHGEPHPDDNGTSEFIPKLGNKMEMETELRSNITLLKSEPDPDDSSNAILNQELGTDEKHNEEPDPDEATCTAVMEECGNNMEVESEQSRNVTISKSEPDPDDPAGGSNISELQRMEEPVAALCARLQKAIKMLRSQAAPAEAAFALQTLFKIIKNVIDHPNDVKYRRLRKSNPQFQRSVANYKAAMEVLELIGFCEDVVSDEIGRADTYLFPWPDNWSSNATDAVCSS
ncbi:hypothetical protein GUJ93_ZPchr0008g12994 [Zizania palustris]|uniref:WLM domain-containing protein n=1 Tax=Zizania palustris TaxID=103762 RepID=A0A8J5RJ18_ZIZPA|nr:hypothetical protein GUJ93_ZPchr0008g12994 [Zizania palustris]